MATAAVDTGPTTSGVGARASEAPSTSVCDTRGTIDGGESSRIWIVADIDVGECGAGFDPGPAVGIGSGVRVAVLATGATASVRGNLVGVCVSTGSVGVEGVWLVRVRFGGGVGPGGTVKGVDFDRDAATQVEAHCAAPSPS